MASFKPKKDTKPEVWHHFGLKQKDGIVVDMKKPVCRQCLLKVSAKRGNTSNLFAHLKTKHPDVYVEVTKLLSKKENRSKCTQDQPSIKESILQEKKLTTSYL